MAVSRAAMRLGASTLGALALGLCIGLAASPSSREHLFGGSGLNQSVTDGTSQQTHYSLRELEPVTEEAQTEAATQEADNMAEVLGDEPEDSAIAQVVLRQAAEDQAEGLPFSTEDLLPTLMGSAENDALPAEPQMPNSGSSGVLSSRQKDTCTHDLEQLYGCSELGASSVSESLADRSICCKRLANLTDRGCFCGWGKGEEMRSWVRLLLLDLADVAVQSCQLSVPCSADEGYFQADKEDAGSQSGQDLAHAVHQAVGDMLSDSSQLAQGQVGPSLYPTIPSKRIQSGGLSLDSELPAPYQAARMQSHASPAQSGGRSQSETSLQQYLPMQAAQASEYVVAHPQEIVALLSSDVPRSLATSSQSKQLVLPEELQGGLVSMRSNDVEAGGQDLLSDQPETSYGQAASSSQPGDSELTIEVELSGDGSMPSTASLREEGKELLASWFIGQLASDSAPVRTGPRLFGKQDMAPGGSGSLGALVESLVDMMWRSLDSSTSEGDMKVEVTVETSQSKGGRRGGSDASSQSEQPDALAVFDPAVRQGTQLSEEGLPAGNDEQQSHPLGEERRQASAPEEHLVGKGGSEADSFGQWLAEHMQQSAMSSYFFAAGLVLLGLSTALFLYYSCSRMCQTREAPLPCWCYRQIGPLAPIEEEGDEELEKQKSAAFPFSGILSAKDHIAPSLREPLLDTRAALSNV
ncbi:hypothetical protein WJX74_010504 [Apatococcus lobatus]|uniref:Transmembrane protein n=1 Tax=Apatococcus lobatus TaxID=904363 RepID=A0AAW1SBY6_9CHLO